MTRWIQLFFLVFAAEPLAAGSSLGVIDLQDAQQPFVLLEGEDAFDAAGRDVAAIGDFNGDGFGDVVIGAYRNNPDGISDAGAAYIVFGSAAGIPAELALADLDGSNGIRFFGRSATDNAGEFVAGIGDIDADGFDDVAIGAIRADPFWSRRSAAPEKSTSCSAGPDRSQPRWTRTHSAAPTAS